MSTSTSKRKRKGVHRHGPGRKQQTATVWIVVGLLAAGAVGWAFRPTVEPATRWPVSESYQRQPVNLATIKACEHEYPTAGETYPCRWDPRERGIYTDGDPLTVIIMVRAEDGCPIHGPEAVCMDVALMDDDAHRDPIIPSPPLDTNPRDVVRWDNGTVEWTTGRGD